MSLRAAYVVAMTKRMADLMFDLALYLAASGFRPEAFENHLIRMA
jgi:hypothetical protein